MVFGGLIFSFRENKEVKVEKKSELKNQQTEKVKQISELEKYNLENKKIYEDFMKFCNKNPNKRKFSESRYEISFSKKYDINFIDTLGRKDLSIYIRNENTFNEHEGNGLDNKFVDSYNYADKNTGLVEVKFIKEVSSEKQLKLAQEYTETLKQIMRDAKYKEY